MLTTTNCRLLVTITMMISIAKVVSLDVKREKIHFPKRVFLTPVDWFAEKSRSSLGLTGPIRRTRLSSYNRVCTRNMQTQSDSMLILE